MQLLLCLLVSLTISTATADNRTGNCRCEFEVPQLVGKATICMNAARLDKAFFLVPHIGFNYTDESKVEEYNIQVDYSRRRARYTPQASHGDMAPWYIHDMENGTITEMASDGTCVVYMVGPAANAPSCVPMSATFRKTKNGRTDIYRGPKGAFDGDLRSVFRTGAGNCRPKERLVSRVEIPGRDGLMLYYFMSIDSYRIANAEEVLYPMHGNCTPTRLMLP